jgi:hypothetical protein
MCKTDNLDKINENEFQLTDYERGLRDGVNTTINIAIELLKNKRPTLSFLSPEMQKLSQEMRLGFIAGYVDAGMIVTSDVKSEVWIRLGKIYLDESRFSK